MYKVFLAPSAERDLKKLPGETFRRVIVAVKALAKTHARSAIASYVEKMTPSVCASASIASSMRSTTEPKRFGSFESAVARTSLGPEIVLFEKCGYGGRTPGRSLPPQRFARRALGTYFAGDSRRIRRRPRMGGSSGPRASWAKYPGVEIRSRTESVEAPLQQGARPRHTRRSVAGSATPLGRMPRRSNTSVFQCRSTKAMASGFATRQRTAWRYGRRSSSGRERWLRWIVPSWSWKPRRRRVAPEQAGRASPRSGRSRFPGRAGGRDSLPPFYRTCASASTPPPPRQKPWASELAGPEPGFEESVFPTETTSASRLLRR